MGGRTYRYFPGEPLYPFGYGLSYTSFAYSKPRVNHRSIAADGSITISAQVENTGAMASDEVVQLYLTHPGVAGAPLRALCGFQRVHLDRRQKQTVSFALSPRDLSIVDEAGKRRIVSGRVESGIGGGRPLTRPGQPEAAGRAGAIPNTFRLQLPD